MSPGTDPRQVRRGVVEPDGCAANRHRLSMRQREPWQAPPLDPPRVDPELDTMGWIERAGEVLRYSLLSIEHAISPDGALRRWLQRVLRAGAFLALPVLLLLPLALVLLNGIAACVELLRRIAVHAFLSGMVIGLVLLAVVIVLRLAGSGRR
jgi:hypothetical protein